MSRIEDEIQDEVEKGLKEENVYSEQAREELIEDDEISAEEEGFMKGYEDDMDHDDLSDSEVDDDD